MNMIGDGAGLGYNVNIPLPQGWLPEPDATLSTTSAVGVSEANAKEASTSAAGTGDGPAYRGLGDVDYAELFDRLVTPLARDFKPQLIIAAAGFDAGVGDSALPIGSYISPGCVMRAVSSIQKPMLVNLLTPFPN